MARYTLERINAKIAIWEAADDAVGLGQSYSIGGKQLTRADARYISERLDQLYAEKELIERGNGSRMVARQGRVAR
jgi:hypothetical protein